MCKISFIICSPPPLSHPLSFHFILFWGCYGNGWIEADSRYVWEQACPLNSHTHTYAHTHSYVHTCTERGQCFSDEKPVCLFHIPLVPGATSEGRESTQTFLQDADVRIKSQTDSCTQQGRKTERKKGEGECKGKERIYAGYGEKAWLHLFEHPVCRNP